MRRPGILMLPSMVRDTYHALIGLAIIVISLETLHEF